MTAPFDQTRREFDFALARQRLAEEIEWERLSDQFEREWRAYYSPLNQLLRLIGLGRPAPQLPSERPSRTSRNRGEGHV